MAQTIVIEQGDKNLNDVTKVTPDTKVNYRSDVKYPQDLFDGTKGQNSMLAQSWEEDEVTFTNPDVIEDSEES